MTTTTLPSSTGVVSTYNGDLTNRGSDTFAWDYEDRMTSATVNSVTTTFAYRGDGLRNSRTMGGVTTGLVGAVAGCVAGAASWVNANYGPADRCSECGVWGAAGGVTAGAPGFVIGCLAGAASADAADLFDHGGSNPHNSSLKEKR